MGSKQHPKPSFEEAVKATSDVASGFLPGLQALGSHSKVIKATDNRKINGSVDIDATTKSLYPQSSRWDYVIGYEDHAYFVEVHPANTSNVDEMIRKRKWLENWLETRASLLKAIKAVSTYYWVPSGKMAILKNSPQYRKIAQNHITIVNKVEL